MRACARGRDPITRRRPAIQTTMLLVACSEILFATLSYCSLPLQSNFNPLHISCALHVWFINISL